MNSKFIGSVLMVVGTAVGAGMLALPMVGASAGFAWSATLMTTMWLISTFSGLLVLEVNLALPSHNASFGSMAGKTIGLSGKAVVLAFYLLLLYTMLTAYIIGESDIVVNYLATTGFKTSHFGISTIFVAILGFAVFWSTKATDYFNRGLVSIKGALVVAALLLIAPYVNADRLWVIPNFTQFKCVWIAAPTFLGAFCYQFIIPSLRIYLGDDPKQLRKVIVTGTTVALLIYIWWLAATLGVVPLEGNNSFTDLAQIEGASVGMFTQLVIAIVNNRWVAGALNGFTIVAMTTAFLGVALGLFDFIADVLKRPNSRWGRFQTIMATLIPPFLFATLYPDGFIMAVNYASIPVAFLCIIFPAMMAYSLRKNTLLKSTYQVAGGKFSIVIACLGGLFLLAVTLMYIMDLLPGLRLG